MPNPYIILRIICMRRQALVLSLYQFKNLPDLYSIDWGRKQKPIN